MATATDERAPSRWRYHLPVAASLPARQGLGSGSHVDRPRISKQGGTGAADKSHDLFGMSFNSQNQSLSIPMQPMPAPSSAAKYLRCMNHSYSQPTGGGPMSLMPVSLPL